MDWPLAGLIIAVGSFLASMLFVAFYELSQKSDDQHGSKPEK